MEIKQLSSALRSVISALHKSLRKQGYTTSAYSMTEMETIGHLTRHDSLLPTELAALTRVKNQSMSQILNKLEQNKLVKRTPSKEDKRKVGISLTASGKKMVDKTIDERDEWLRTKIEQTLSAKEKELLEKALPVLSKLLG